MFLKSDSNVVKSTKHRINRNLFLPLLNVILTSAACNKHVSNGDLPRNLHVLCLPVENMPLAAGKYQKYEFEFLIKHFAS
jgi:hypothetical protein